MLAGNKGIADLEKTGHKLSSNMVVHGLWKRDKICILDIVVTDTDTKSYKYVSLRAVIKGAAQKKEKKYLDACLERYKTFIPLLYSVAEMTGKEAKAFEKHIVALLTEKWGWAYNEMCG